MQTGYADEKKTRTHCENANHIVNPNKKVSPKMKLKQKTRGGHTLNNCIWIIRKYLEEHGFDGLYDGDTCACETNDIVPCSKDFSFCLPGYRTETPGGEFDFEIGPVKKKDDTPT